MISIQPPRLFATKVCIRIYTVKFSSMEFCFRPSRVETTQIGIKSIYLGLVIKLENIPDRIDDKLFYLSYSCSQNEVEVDLDVRTSSDYPACLN